MNEQPAATSPSLAPLSRALDALGWLAASGLSSGLFVALCFWHATIAQYVSTNRAAPGERTGILGCMAVGLLVAVLPALGVMVRRGPEGVERVHQWARTLSPLVVLGFVPMLLNVDAWLGWVNSELAVAVFISLVTAVAFGTVGQSLAQPPVLPARLRARREAALAWVVARPHLATGLAVAAALFFAVYFSAFSLSNHYSLFTSAYDLGIEDNLMWNLLHGGKPLFFNTPIGAGAGFSHAAWHQTWIAYVFALLYAPFQDARFFLVFQAILLGSAALPLFAFAKLHLGPWWGALVAWLYVLYPPLHGATLYDFHYQPLSIPLLFVFAYCMHRDWPLRATLTVLVTLACREDLGLLVAVVCAWLALSGHRPKTALALMALSLTHFVVLKLLIMPRFLGGGESFVSQYLMLLPEGESGFGGVLKTVLANPGYTVAWLVEPGKQLYVLQVLGPLAFLPLVRKFNLLLLVPGFFFTLLSTKYVALILISFQYSAYWVPFVFLATIGTLEVLRREKPLLASTLAFVLPLAMIAHSRQFGAVLKQTHVHASFHTEEHLVPTPEDRQRHADLEAVLAKLPPGESVAAAEMLVPHVSARELAYTLRNGITDAQWLLAMFPARSDELAQLVPALGPDGAYGVVEVRGVFLLARKGAPKDQNAAAKQLLRY